MRWVELVNVEYGECVVLGGTASVLMVDCGSINHKTRVPEVDMPVVFDFIKDRYDAYGEKHFLLSHYHRDHICGFFRILSQNSNYFDKVYIPFIPTDTMGNSPILDYAIYSRIFTSSKTDVFQVNTSCLNIFKTLGDKIGHNRIYTLKQDDQFYFDSNYYQVLNPVQTDFFYPIDLKLAVEKADELMINPEFFSFGQEFLNLKSRFIAIYNRCLQAFSSVNRKDPLGLRSLTEELSIILFAIEQLKEKLNSSNVTDEIKEILQSRKVSEAYSEAMNSISIVFHNVRKKETSLDDILMTGDINRHIFENIYDKLYSSYYILKAPHHGTESGYSEIISSLSPAHILISSGDYGKDNDISESYYAMESIKHCTNNVKCKFFAASSACCNRLNYCYDLAIGAGLSIKCPANRKTTVKNDCKIYVVTPTEGRSCFCDTSRS